MPDRLKGILSRWHRPKPYLRASKRQKKVGSIPYAANGRTAGRRNKRLDGLLRLAEQLDAVTPGRFRVEQGHIGVIEQADQGVGGLTHFGHPDADR
jgi:hypothetical protein